MHPVLCIRELGTHWHTSLITLTTIQCSDGWAGALTAEVSLPSSNQKGTLFVSLLQVVKGFPSKKSLKEAKSKSHNALGNILEIHVRALVKLFFTVLEMCSVLVAEEMCE